MDTTRRFEFPGLNLWFEIEIFRKVIKVKHNIQYPNLYKYIRPIYSCYDLVVLETQLKEFLDKQSIDNIIYWIKDNCEYLQEQKPVQDQGQLSLF